jgi:hypothetical protein
MPRVTDQVRQEHPKLSKRQSLPVLSKVTLAGLPGVALAVTTNLLIVWLLHGVLVPEFFIVIVPTLFHLVIYTLLNKDSPTLPLHVRTGALL